MEGMVIGDTVPEEGELRDLGRFDEGHRRRLVEGILADLRRWGAPASAVTSAERLVDPDVGAVVTGQQAGIAGGPLYTLYKAVGAVRAAAELERRYPGRSAVPVFWIEGEDHDFDEVRSVGLLENSGDLRKVSYDDGDSRPVSIASRPVDPEAWRSFVDDLVDVLGTTDFTDDLLELLNGSYLHEGESLVDGFARFMYALLGEGTPLVLLSASSPALRTLASDVLEGEALNPDTYHDAVVRGTEAAARGGLPTPIDPRPGHLFLQHNGERIALDPEDGGYHLRRTDLRFTREEIATIARTAPGRLSGNVALRPVIQDAILPTFLYLGGPGELAYLGQVRELYRVAGIAPPAVAPRPFVLLIEPKVERVLGRDIDDLRELLAEDFDPVARVVDPEVEAQIGKGELEGVEQIAAAFDRFTDLISSIDPTLEKAAGASQTRATKELESLAGRLRGALKRTHEAEINRLRSARALLLPGGSLQERQLSILHYLNRYGIEVVRRVLGEVTVGEKRVQVLVLR